MYDVKGNLKQVLDRLPQGVRLVAILIKLFEPQFS